MLLHTGIHSQDQNHFDKSKSLSRFLNRKFTPHKPLLPSNVLATAGASNAIECYAWSLFNEGDYILVGRPY